MKFLFFYTQLATENNLKTDSIYKTRWFSDVLQTNNESSQLNSLFSNVLNHITDRTWVHHICKTHTCQTLDGTMSFKTCFPFVDIRGWD